MITICVMSIVRCSSATPPIVPGHVQQHPTIGSHPGIARPTAAPAPRAQPGGSRQHQMGPTPSRAGPNPLTSIQGLISSYPTGLVGESPVQPEGERCREQGQEGEAITLERAHARDPLEVEVLLAPPEVDAEPDGRTPDGRRDDRRRSSDPDRAIGVAGHRTGRGGHAHRRVVIVLALLGPLLAGSSGPHRSRGERHTALSTGGEGAHVRRPEVPVGRTKQPQREAGMVKKRSSRARVATSWPGNPPPLPLDRCA